MRLFIAFCVFFVFCGPVFAGPEAFHPGPAIPDYGKIAAVDSDQPIPANAIFKVRFDAGKGADAGKLNRTLSTAARFINMHVAAGMKEENIQLAVVLHGQGAIDVTRAAYYGAHRDGAQNANAGLVKALAAHGVKFYVCGQTAAYYDISKDDLLPGVSMSLSALTAHAILHNEGYALNPF